MNLVTLYFVSVYDQHPTDKRNISLQWLCCCCCCWIDDGGIGWYQVVLKVRATTLLLLTRKKWFPPLYRGRTFTIVHRFWSDWIIPFVRKKNSFHNNFCPYFKHVRYWISTSHKVFHLERAERYRNPPGVG